MSTTFKETAATWYPYKEVKKTVIVTPVLDKSYKKLIYQKETPCAHIAFNDAKLLKQIPINLVCMAPNIRSLSIYKCGLSKITRSDLKGLEKLTHLALEKMAFKELPADLLADLPDLEIVSFAENAIRYVDRNIFKHLGKLKFGDLSGNPGVNILYANASNEFDCPAGTARFWKIEEFNLFLDALFPSNLVLELRKVMESSEFKDFTVKIGEEEMKVHKLMLVAQSPRLAEMIRNNPDATELILQDIEADVFKAMLDYIYNNVLPPVNDEKTEKVFAAAGKLKLEGLKNKIGDALCGKVTTENSMKFFTLASNHGHENLKKKAFEELKSFLADDSLPDKLMNNIEVLNEMYQAKKAYDDRMNKAKQKI